MTPITIRATATPIVSGQLKSIGTAVGSTAPVTTVNNKAMITPTTIRIKACPKVALIRRWAGIPCARKTA